MKRIRITKVGVRVSLGFIGFWRSKKWNGQKLKIYLKGLNVRKKDLFYSFCVWNEWREIKKLVQRPKGQKAKVQLVLLALKYLRKSWMFDRKVCFMSFVSETSDKRSKSLCKGQKAKGQLGLLAWKYLRKDWMFIRKVCFISFLSETSHLRSKSLCKGQKAKGQLGYCLENVLARLECLIERFVLWVLRVKRVIWDNKKVKSKDCFKG